MLAGDSSRLLPSLERDADSSFHCDLQREYKGVPFLKTTPPNAETVGHLVCWPAPFSAGLFADLAVVVPPKKHWGTSSPAQPPGNIGCSHCSPVPPFFEISHTLDDEQSRPEEACSVIKDWGTDGDG